MKEIINLAVFTFISMTALAQNSRVGINTDTPEATLDIKSANSNGDEVLRFSTPPSSMPAADNKFVFFVGDPVKNGDTTVAYDLKSLTLPDFVNKMNSLFPSLNKITLTNSKDQKIKRDAPTGDDKLLLDTALINTNKSVYSHDESDNAIQFLKDGYYEITAFVGFERILAYEGDVLISVLIKKSGSNTYQLYKSAIVSRTLTNSKSVYQIGTGVGSSFSFVNEFQSGDKIRLQVNSSYTPPKAWRTSTKEEDNNFNILSNGATISATRLSPLIN